jgi:hypothetical protein
MKRFTVLAVVFLFLAFVPFCRADLIPGESTCGDDGDGVLHCTSAVFGAKDGDEFPLTIEGYHTAYNDVTHEPDARGHLIGDFVTDGSDPNLRITNYIDNDTDFDWTDFHLNISMDQPFSIYYAAVDDPGDWTSSYTADSSWDGEKNVGHIDFLAGTSIPHGTDPLSTLQFTYKMTFTGDANFCVEMIPTPEPASIVLLLSGLLLGGFVLIRRR